MRTVTKALVFSVIAFFSAACNKNDQLDMSVTEKSELDVKSLTVSPIAVDSLVLDGLSDVSTN
jgi:hypothetical protein